MITRVKSVRALYLLAITTIGFMACNKEISSSIETSTSAVIAVAASETAATTGTSADSVYVIQFCTRGSQRVSIAEGNLPAAVTTYLITNYTSYTFNKAFAINNSSGTTTAYVAIIYYNDKPVAVLFDSSGNFIKVLEQREKSDLDDHGWHEGGRFCDRDGLQKDTVAISALPSSILNYISVNYPQDTLVKAFKNNYDSSYVVISKNNGLFATIFDSNENFIKRVTLPAPAGSCVNIAQSALPANVLSYLDTTYPNYVFDKAFAAYKDSVLQGYVVILNANNTKYAVRFDVSGNFVLAKTIW
jgi:hypothetical protein